MAAWNALLVLTLLGPPEPVAPVRPPSSSTAPASATLPSQPRPADRPGVPMILFGALGAGPIAVPLVTVGALILAEKAGPNGDSGGSAGAFMLPLGLISFVAGIGLLVVGARRHSVWKARRAGVALRLQLGHASGAWTPGLTLRF